ncbi:MAG: ribosome biogenesis GTPase Der [Chloroflexi bacterium 13_1_40CM_4_68_4]|nr:MAG: ribosome biogenesis GTPase Der [Chloroflexi bacterium 13_1_40CM_4_68_4]
MSPSQPRPQPSAAAARGVAAIVGRPNVGKSALFNRLMGQRVAIVEDVPGTTRDRLYGTVEWRGRAFTIVDTGGIEEPQGDAVRVAVQAQAEAAIQESDVVLFVVDAASGLIGVDHDVADLLRKSRKPVILVANKAESDRRALAATEFYELGLADPLPVSALHGTGTGDLLDAVVAALPEREELTVEADARIAIVGRPNVGKSSLLNTIVGRERAVVSPTPGTTRDPVDTLLDHDGRRVLLVDTAGLRRRGKIEPGIEAYATLRTVRAVDRSDVAILLIDATEGVTAQDLHVAGYVLEEFKGLVIGVNKWDAVERGEDTTDRVRAELRRAFHFAPWAPEIFLSAKSGRNVAAIMDAALAAATERRKRIDPPELRRFLIDALGKHPPASDGGVPLRFTHVIQSELPEPVFIFFLNRPDAVHFSYRRYLENELRRRFGFAGTPIRLVFKGGRD